MNIVSLPTEGEQPYDMATEFDPLRYGGWAGDAYTAAKVTETYSHNNSVTYPHENCPAGRDHVAHPPGRAALLAALRARGALLSFSNAGACLSAPPARGGGGGDSWR